LLKSGQYPYRKKERNKERKKKERKKKRTTDDLCRVPSDSSFYILHSFHHHFYVIYMKLVGGSQKIILEVNTDFPTILILIPVHYIAINLQSSSLSFNFEPNFCDLYTACVKQNMCSAV